MSENERLRKEEVKNSDDVEAERGGFTAVELGKASAYEGVTEIAQMMRRGDEQDNADRDVVQTAKEED